MSKESIKKGLNISYKKLDRAINYLCRLNNFQSSESVRYNFIPAISRLEQVLESIAEISTVFEAEGYEEQRNKKDKELSNE